MAKDREGARLSLRLLEIRQRLGYRQADMAYHMKVSALTYWRWEKYGVPNRVYQRMMIKLMLEKLSRKAKHMRYDRGAKGKARRSRNNTRLAVAAD